MIRGTISVYNFVLSDTEGNTPGQLNRGRISDLTLLRKLLTIRKKSLEQSFWKVTDSFHLLV